MEPQKGSKIKEKNRIGIEFFKEQNLETKVAILENHLMLCQLFIRELFEEEVIERAGDRYSHTKPHEGRYSRWGYNPGSVKIGDTKLKIDIPRIYDSDEKSNIPLEVYHHLKEVKSPTEQLLKAVLLGLSTRDYEEVIDYVGEGFGLSKSNISRSFVDRTKEKLIEFESRKLDKYDIVSIFIDGKYLAKEQIIIVLGVTIDGHKVPLGFVQSATENSSCIKDLFNGLIERGLKSEQGILFVVDGSKGISKAIEEVFPETHIIQRCRWHKRENVIKYLPEKHQEEFKRKYHQALAEDSYKEAKARLVKLKHEVEIINISAGRSLEEGMEELLTLHKLGLNSTFIRSFSTTNCIENLNSQLHKYLKKVKYWKNSNERYRWVATALLEIEHKMRKVDKFEKLMEMRIAVQTALKISTKIGT